MQKRKFTVVTQLHEENNREIIEYIEYISMRPKMYLIKYDYEELINHISFKRIFDLITEKDILFFR